MQFLLTNIKELIGLFLFQKCLRKLSNCTWLNQYTVVSTYGWLWTVDVDFHWGIRTIWRRQLHVFHVTFFRSQFTICRKHKCTTTTRSRMVVIIIREVKLGRCVTCHSTFTVCCTGLLGSGNIQHHTRPNNMVVVTHQSSYNGIDALINVLLMSVLCHTLMAYYIILYQDE